jgi:UDP-N-acetylmuramoyl-L-alanyl-D-glutamate--2,6-diaminopimelate ligase
VVVIVIVPSARVMARIATELSSHVVLTSDNPRSEDPMAILNEMRSGVRPMISTGCG